jgi:serine/threonine protein kinase
MDPKIFGRYQIIRKLAGGGMGRVYLAYDPVLNRQVGLKLIDAGGDP